MAASVKRHVAGENYRHTWPSWQMATRKPKQCLHVSKAFFVNVQKRNRNPQNSLKNQNKYWPCLCSRARRRLGVWTAEKVNHVRFFRGFDDYESYRVCFFVTCSVWGVGFFDIFRGFSEFFRQFGRVRWRLRGVWLFSFVIETLIVWIIRNCKLVNIWSCE